MAIQIPGGGRRGDTPAGGNAQAAVLPAVLLRGPTAETGHPFWSPLPRQLSLRQSYDFQICENRSTCLKTRRRSATPELRSKGVSGLTALKKPGFQLHGSSSELAPLERFQMGWPAMGL